jgi:hypothetical protein
LCDLRIARGAETVIQKIIPFPIVLYKQLVIRNGIGKKSGRYVGNAGSQLIRIVKSVGEVFFTGSKDHCSKKGYIKDCTLHLDGFFD